MTAESGAIDMARVLLDAGADPNIYYDKCDGARLGGVLRAAAGRFEVVPTCEG
jgi:hypothetical protein